MKIAIGSDHAGFVYKEKIKEFLTEKGLAHHDFGTDSEESVDYPQFIRPVALAVSRGEYDRGIVLGGSGNGEAMVANRVPGIRCALCWNRETAGLSRKHNDANMLSLGARMVSEKQAIEIVQVWLNTGFEGGRHVPRIRQIDEDNAMPGRAPLEKEAADRETAGTSSLEPAAERTDEFDLLIAFRYIKYMEGKKTLEFQVDPGLKQPTVIHIPSAETWKAEMPAWARDRRDEILGRLQPQCAHLKAQWKEY